MGGCTNFPKTPRTPLTSPPTAPASHPYGSHLLHPYGSRERLASPRLPHSDRRREVALTAVANDTRAMPQGRPRRPRVRCQVWQGLGQVQEDSQVPHRAVRVLVREYDVTGRSLKYPGRAFETPFRRLFLLLLSDGSWSRACAWVTPRVA